MFTKIHLCGPGRVKQLDNAMLSDQSLSSMQLVSRLDHTRKVMWETAERVESVALRWACAAPHEITIDAEAADRQLNSQSSSAKARPFERRKRQRDAGILTGQKHHRD